MVAGAGIAFDNLWGDLYTVDALRTFIAFDVPPFVLKTVAEIQNRFKSLGLRASWVVPANMHLTLKFLGEIDPGRVAEIREALPRKLSRLSGFQVCLSGVGVFPNLSRPRVLWIGLKDQTGALESLQSKIEEALSGLGFPRETRPFAPHLTLGRIKSVRDKNRLRNELQSIRKIEPRTFEVRSIKLYKSQLTPEGSLYTVLEEFNLKH